jgi:cholesterol transport system auxiliary component
LTRFSKRPAAVGVLISVLAATLAGCAGNILPGAQIDPPRLYVLTPKSTFAPELPNVDWQLTVDVPIAEASLNTARIALKRSPVTLEYYERANWIDTAPIMVQTLLVESFENSNRIVGVGRQSIAIRSDYTLVTDLREFHAEYFRSGIPEARVRLNAKLVRMPERVIVGVTTVERLQAADGTDIDSVIAAFDAALGKTMKRIVEWALTTAKNPSDRGPASRRR